MVDLSIVSLGLFTSAIIAGVLASVVAAIYMCCHRYGFFKPYIHVFIRPVQSRVCFYVSLFLPFQ